MDIQKALRLRVGDTVSFPSDRGSPAGSAKIVSTSGASAAINHNIYDQPYIWIGLEAPNGVWPSNRLLP